MKFNQALPYIAILLFVSCSTPKFVTSGEEYPKLHLDLGIDFIVVKDKRGNISISDDLELPFISKAGQSDIVVPPLKNEYEAIIKQTVVDNLKPNSKNTAILTIHVINARKEFHVTSWSERETAFIELKIFVKTILPIYLYKGIFPLRAIDLFNILDPEIAAYFFEFIISFNILIIYFGLY